MRTRRQLILLVLKNSLMNQQARTAATLPAPPTPSSLFFFSSSRRPTTIQYTRSHSYSTSSNITMSGSGSANPDLDSLFDRNEFLEPKSRKISNPCLLLRNLKKVRLQFFFIMALIINVILWITVVELGGFYVLIRTNLQIFNLCLKLDLSTNQIWKMKFVD